MSLSYQNHEMNLYLFFIIRFNQCILESNFVQPKNKRTTKDWIILNRSIMLILRQEFKQKLMDTKYVVGNIIINFQ